MNYKEEVIEGQTTKWMRAKEVTIKNTFGQVPSLSFTEEVMIKLPDGTVVQGQLPDRHRDLTANLLYPKTEFPLIHTETEQVIGTAKYQDIFVLLFSLHRALAKTRDEKVVK